MDLNRAMIIGRLTRDPEIRTTPNGQDVANFSVATNFAWSNQSGEKQQTVEYHNVVAWRKLAGICGQYLKKGSRVFIEGRLQTRNWEAKDGSKRSTTEIVAENMLMLDSKGSSGPKTDFSNKSEEKTKPAPENKKEEEEEISIEDIPF
jgi:single-strand DNA-binding protein